MFNMFNFFHKNKREQAAPVTTDAALSKSPFPKDLTRIKSDRVVDLPVPVMFLLDVSGSMYGDEIKALNQAVRELIETFRQDEKKGREYRIAAISFASSAKLLFPFKRASDIRWRDLDADGGTNLGDALIMAKGIIEDRVQTPSLTHQPTIVLISDGEPFDGWKEPMDDFIKKGRSGKCNRISMGIGTGADTSVLNRFMAGTGNTLFTAHDAGRIGDFFKKIVEDLRQLMHGETIGH